MAEPERKKAKKDPSPGDIKSFALFNNSFPHVSIPSVDESYGKMAPPLKWSVPALKGKIKMFLQRFATNSYEVLTACNNSKLESDLYPLLFGLLASLKATTQNVLIETNLKPSKDTEDIFAAAEDLSSKVKRRHSSLEAGLAAMSEPEESEEEVPDDVDMTSAEDIVKVYLAMEKWFLNHPSHMKSRAELVLMDEKRKCTQAIFNVKCTNMMEGLYQCAAHMVLASAEREIVASTSSTTAGQRVIWGAVSTFQEWKFLRLEGNSISISANYVLFSGDRDCLHAVHVVNFLFEIFNIDPTIDMTETFRVIDEKSENYGNYAVEFL